MRPWREAMAAALYGPGGFFVRPGNPAAAHFRTSAHASPLFAGAMLRLLERLDRLLGGPDPLDLVDVGAGRGELLTALLDAAPAGLRGRLRPVAVELAPAPAAPRRSPGQTTLPGIWRDRVPAPVTGLVLATEWLDNVPMEVAEVDPAGIVRYVLVDPASGEEALGEPVTGADADWLARWWPLAEPGDRAEIGRSRDEAWAGAVGALERGAALSVDYGHLAGGRPPFGTITGFRDGREVRPVPDGSCDLTAHVAVDAVAAAGAFALHTHTRPPDDAAHVAVDAVAAGAFALHTHTPPIRRHPAGAGPADPVLVTQREALRALGVDGARPPLAQASTDPAGYVRALASASAAAELTEPSGLGGHYWLLQPVALPGLILPGL